MEWTLELQQRMREEMLERDVGPGKERWGRGGPKCCGGILHNRTWTGKMLRVDQGIGT